MERGGFNNPNFSIKSNNWSRSKVKNAKGSKKGALVHQDPEKEFELTWNLCTPEKRVWNAKAQVDSVRVSITS